jgi:hypothetical protein
MRDEAKGGFTGNGGSSGVGSGVFVELTVTGDELAPTFRVIVVEALVLGLTVRPSIRVVANPGESATIE